MKIERIESLLKLMAEYGCMELELEEEDESIHLSMLGSGAVAQAAPVPVPLAVALGAPAVADDANVYEEVCSPMVGTFYSAPKPGSPNFVKVGDQVSVGQTLCIVEAMKLMNEIESEVSGTVKAISVDNAGPVQFGQVMFLIDAD